MNARIPMAVFLSILSFFSLCILTSEAIDNRPPGEPAQGQFRPAEPPSAQAEIQKRPAGERIQGDFRPPEPTPLPVSEQDRGRPREFKPGEVTTSGQPGNQGPYGGPGVTVPSGGSTPSEPGKEPAIATESQKFNGTAGPTATGDPKAGRYEDRNMMIDQPPRRGDQNLDPHTIEKKAQPVPGGTEGVGAVKPGALIDERRVNVDQYAPTGGSPGKPGAGGVGKEFNLGPPGKPDSGSQGGPGIFGKDKGTNIGPGQQQGSNINTTSGGLTNQPPSKEYPGADGVNPLYKSMGGKSVTKQQFKEGGGKLTTQEQNSVTDKLADVVTSAGGGGVSVRNSDDPVTGSAVEWEVSDSSGKTVAFVVYNGASGNLLFIGKLPGSEGTKNIPEGSPPGKVGNPKYDADFIRRQMEADTSDPRPSSGGWIDPIGNKGKDIGGGRTMGGAEADAIQGAGRNIGGMAGDSTKGHHVVDPSRDDQPTGGGSGTNVKGFDWIDPKPAAEKMERK